MQKLLIVIPCFNEAKRLPINEFNDFIKNKEMEFIHFLFVNDGSSDETLEVINNLSKEHRQVEVLDLKHNVGKAEAIRQGVLHSMELNFDYIGYFDADLAAPLSEVDTLLQAIKFNPYMILGARVKLLGSTIIKRKLARHYIGRVFATIVSNMLKLPIYDTQCGAKLIRNDVAQTIFEKSFISKWLFDVELLFRIKNNYKDFENKIVEVPLKQWEDKSGSKIKLSYYFQAPIDLLRIYFRYN